MRRWAGLCPVPVVPASSEMCLRTSSSGTNFTCRERRLPRIPSGRLMAAPLTWARPRRRGALPPVGRGPAPPHPSPLTAPLLRDRDPAGSPRPRQRRRQREADPGSRASQGPSPRQPTRAPYLEGPVRGPTRALLPARLGRGAGLPPPGPRAPPGSCPRSLWRREAAASP